MFSLNHLLMGTDLCSFSSTKNCILNYHYFGTVPRHLGLLNRFIKCCFHHSCQCIICYLFKIFLTFIHKLIINAKIISVLFVCFGWLVCLLTEKHHNYTICLFNLADLMFDVWPNLKLLPQSYYHKLTLVLHIYLFYNISHLFV